MSSELRFTATVTFTSADGRTRSVQVPERFGDTTKTTVLIQSVGFAAEEPLVLGDVASPTACMIVNLDATNYVNVKIATGGGVVAKLAKDTNSDGNGGFMLVSELGSGMQAPYLQANTGSCDVLVLVAE